jgi:putative ABC transport system permease protein
VTPHFTLILAPLLQHKGRLLLSAGAIAIGVALGYAIHIINRAAIDELARAGAMLSGEAELTVRGPRAGFDEGVYPMLALRPEVRDASPSLEFEARLRGSKDALRVIGIDVFRAVSVQPALLARATNADDDPLESLRADALFLSPGAAHWLAVSRGDEIALQTGTSEVPMRVAGVLAEGAGSGRFGLMDIAAAQRSFGRLGTITRIDLDLREGASAERLMTEVSSMLPAGVVIERPQSAIQANARLSRAYRVNLNVLALVALFTGGLLVFSTQALSVVRRRGQLALLRVVGVTRASLGAMLVAEGAVVGMLGGVVGLVCGASLASAMLYAFGADLGAGYFRGRVATLDLEPVSATIFLVLGVLAAAVGSLAPAIDAARTPLAQALKSGDEFIAFKRLRPVWPGLVLLIAGGLLTLSPPVAELPVGGFAAIALLLLGALLLMPRLASAVAESTPLSQTVWARLAIAQLRQASNQASIGLAALVASLSLSVAMAIMVASFRGSLDEWLERVLPADLYVRAAPSGDTGFLSPAVQRQITTLAGVRRVEFLRTQHFVLNPSRPRVTLIARDLEDPARTLPLIRGESAVDPERPDAWVSEHLADVFGWQPGSVIELPIAGRFHEFTVAGIWRDYARQNGAVVVERAVYSRLSGDLNANDAGLWLQPGVEIGAVAAALRANVPGGERLEIARPEQIRDRSLSIFDRTFAVTYALEAVAIAIGLAGLSANFAARAFARRREFGMLRHVGVTRMQVLAMLAFEGVLLAAIAALAGLVLGWIISLLLVHVVNRQSFHWSMEMHYPVGGMIAFLAALLVLAAVTAAASGRQAMSGESVRAVKEDW